MQDLTGRTAVVTGGGSGIGRGIVLGLADEGMRVALLDLNEDGALAVAEEIAGRGGEALGLPANVTSSESLAGAAKEIVARFGGVDLLCANAGVMLPIGPLL